MTESDPLLTEHGHEAMDLTTRLTSAQWRDLGKRLRKIDMAETIRLRRERFEEEHRLRAEFHHRLGVACYEAQRQVFP